MKTNRLLLLQFIGGRAKRRVDRLRELGFEVVTADPYDLHWPKMVTGGDWSVIIVDLACLGEIAVEVAAELEDYPDTGEFEVLLLGREGDGPPDLPTPLRSGRRFDDDEVLLKTLAREFR
jgi:hypothetical protein